MMWTLVHPERATIMAFRTALAAELYRQEWMLDGYVVRLWEAKEARHG